MPAIRVCSLDAVPSGGMRQFNVRDRELLVVNCNGQISCLDARCTHAGAPLEEGTLEGDVLTCPWHGSQFNVANGSVIHGPAENPLTTYSVAIKDEGVFIEL